MCSSAIAAGFAPLLLLGLPSFPCICSFLQPHIQIAHPLDFAGFQRFVASKNQFVPGKKVSRPRGRDGVVPEKGKSVCDPLRVRGDLSEGGVSSNLDQRVILCNYAFAPFSFKVCKVLISDHEKVDHTVGEGLSTGSLGFVTDKVRSGERTRQPSSQEWVSPTQGT